MASAGRGLSLVERIAAYICEHPCDVCDGTRGDCDDLADRVLAEFGDETTPARVSSSEGGAADA